jgi:hypothetical protein
MNILVEEFPSAISVNGKVYPANTDYRVGINIILAFEDPELIDAEKQMVLLEALYKDAIEPENLEQAVKQGIKYLNGGELSEEEETDGLGLRLYSFSQDANYIFAAFRQSHGIDLETEKMHWWKFIAYFMDLGSNTTFSNLIALRQRLQTGKASKEDRQMARDLGKIVELPSNEFLTPDELEKEKEFLRLVSIGKQSNGS